MRTEGICTHTCMYLWSWYEGLEYILTKAYMYVIKKSQESVSESQSTCVHGGFPKYVLPMYMQGSQQSSSYGHLVQAPSGKTPYITHLFIAATSLYIAATDFQSVGDHYRQVPLYPLILLHRVTQVCLTSSDYIIGEGGGCARYIYC